MWDNMAAANIEGDGKAMNFEIALSRALLLSLENEDEKMALLFARSFLALDTQNP